MPKAKPKSGRALWPLVSTWVSWRFFACILSMRTIWESYLRITFPSKVRVTNAKWRNYTRYLVFNLVYGPWRIYDILNLLPANEYYSITHPNLLNQSSIIDHTTSDDAITFCNGVQSSEFARVIVAQKASCWRSKPTEHDSTRLYKNGSISAVIRCS